MYTDLQKRLYRKIQLQSLLCFVFLNQVFPLLQQAKENRTFGENGRRQTIYLSHWPTNSVKPLQGTRGYLKQHTFFFKFKESHADDN